MTHPESVHVYQLFTHTYYDVTDGLAQRPAADEAQAIPSSHPATYIQRFRTRFRLFRLQ